LPNIDDVGGQSWYVVGIGERAVLPFLHVKRIVLRPSILVTEPVDARDGEAMTVVQ
jgi:hypothetical protein